jgi:hypothetical protein
MALQRSGWQEPRAAGAYVGSGGTTAIPASLTGRPRVPGTTQFYAPSAAPDHVWLVRYRNGVLGQAPVRAQSVSIADDKLVPVITLPAAAAKLVEGTNAGLLLEIRAPTFGLALWNPGAAPVALPYSPLSEDLVDATPRLVAYGTGCGWRITAAHGVSSPRTCSRPSWPTPAPGPRRRPGSPRTCRTRRPPGRGRWLRR